MKVLKLLLKQIIISCLGLVFCVQGQSQVIDSIKELQREVEKYAQDEREVGNTSYARYLESQVSILRDYAERFGRVQDSQTYEKEIGIAKQYLESLNKKINEWTGLQKAAEKIYVLRPEEARGLKIFMKIDQVRRDL